MLILLTITVSNMHFLDYIGLSLFFLILLFVAVRSTKEKSLLTYWLNKRSSGLWLLTFSHVASITIASAVIGLVGAVYDTGISLAISSAVAAVIGMLILALVAKKIYEIPEEYRFTLVDVFKWRFGNRVKYPITVLLTVILFLLIAVNLIAISQLGSVLTGLDYNVILWISMAIVIAYTTIGGMKTDLFTDFIQFWFMGGLLIMLLVTGTAHNGFDIIKNLSKNYYDPFAFGGVGFFVGSILIGGFVYLMNSATWQRIFSAKSEVIGKKSLVYAIPFMLLISVVTMCIGLFAAGTLGEVNRDQAMYLLIAKLLPPGLVGLGYAGILSIILSSLDSLLIGGSTILSREFNIAPSVRNARLTTLSLGLTAATAAYLFPDIIQLTLFGTFLMLALTPSLLFGLYSKKASTEQALIALIGAPIVVILFSFVNSKTAFMPAVLFSVIVFLIPFRSASKQNNRSAPR